MMNGMSKRYAENTPPQDPITVRYYHGRITREEAEARLRCQGGVQGDFLLRDSLGKEGHYAISLCFDGNIYHYAIERQHDGGVAIKDGNRFPGPVELVQHHERKLDGLLCLLQRPCCLPEGQKPRAYGDLSHEEMENEIALVAQNQGLSKDTIQKAIASNRSQFDRLVKSILHQERPWFHGQLTRAEAEQRIITSGLQEGKFLARERNEPGSFALTLCYNNSVYHYKIDKDCTGQLSIKDGPKFDSLLQMVDHYTLKKDGLLCCLMVPCIDPQKRRHSAGPAASASQNYRRVQSNDEESMPARSPPAPPQPRRGNTQSAEETTLASFMPPPLKPHVPYHPSHPVHPPHMPRQRPMIEQIVNGKWEEPDHHDEPSPQRLSSQEPPVVDDKTYGVPNDREMIYGQVAKMRNTKLLDVKHLYRGEPIGKGNFGSVLKGTYNMHGTHIPVAIKTLKTENGIPNSKPEIVKEAEIMADLDHQHIVRMIGICEGFEMMLVLELAELGPLHKYLKRHTNMSIRNVLELMLQVAKGMRYLESQKFVHRDLAARNVLLVDETFAKISDFGMSKALGLDSQYYVAETAGRWPLKWYAPECIYRFKFSSKSDVWSYGVTLWEALSYGKKPYANMKGQELMAFIESGSRLAQPERCPPEVYTLMRQCWEDEARDRPSFGEIVDTMTSIIRRLRAGTLRIR
ncbi:tyrosine-protein kinase SYK-like [Acanthaster planci]|uniref:Tyrosine-protein kinase n=1 Tax=Acanthaster planci TaxID=133434 RepID=A0A8B7Z5M6_ACAPL|nr:tyrosine-protein kinase SYK-like [Acanthaster planci]XP_022100263.1 tyrosine-protein kinase SYK-like [Acanthaster planci]